MEAQCPGAGATVDEIGGGKKRLGIAGGARLSRDEHRRKVSRPQNFQHKPTARLVMEPLQPGIELAFECRRGAGGHRGPPHVRAQLGHQPAVGTGEMA